VFDAPITFRVRRHRDGDRIAGARGRVTRTGAASLA